ncbi:MAG: TadE family protein [Burkholderiaceae bacterium]|jgi:Flp pilus assembly protein TadG
MTSAKLFRQRFARGSSSIEFALVAAFGGLFVILIGTMELGRVLFYLNTANEATRLGARIAVVCDANAAQIKTRMTEMLTILDPAKISVTYLPAGCATSADTARNTCQSVTVEIASGLQIDTAIPFVPFSLDMPAFSTTLSREAMDSANCS